MAERACKWCGTLFGARMNQLYCSPPCKKANALEKRRIDGISIDPICRFPGCDRRRLRKSSARKYIAAKEASARYAVFAKWCAWHSRREHRETPEQRRARLDPGRLNGLG